MPLSQRYLQTVKVLSIFLLACFATCQEAENKRAVTEHQLLNDRGRALQGLKRLMWLHNAMTGVHTATDRGRISRAHIMWTSPNSQDLSDFYESMGKEETPDTMKQLLLEQLEKESPFSVLRKTNVLQYLKNVKGQNHIGDCMSAKILSHPDEIIQKLSHGNWPSFLERLKRFTAHPSRFI